MTSTEAAYGALNDRIQRRCIETVNLTEISVELDSSAPSVLAWLKSSRHHLGQSDVKRKTKPINGDFMWSHTFSLPGRGLRVFAMDSCWFIVMFAFVAIGQFSCWGFGFSTLKKNRFCSQDSTDLLSQSVHCSFLSCWRRCCLLL